MTTLDKVAFMNSQETLKEVEKDLLRDMQIVEVYYQVDAFQSGTAYYFYLALYEDGIMINTDRFQVVNTREEYEVIKKELKGMKAEFREMNVTH